jgi:hypothetical protein
MHPGGFAIEAKRHRGETVCLAFDVPVRERQRFLRNGPIFGVAAFEIRVADRLLP